MKRLPIGIQNFEKILVNSYIYEYAITHLYNFIKRHYFIPHPHQFEKSFNKSQEQINIRKDYEKYRRKVKSIYLIALNSQKKNKNIAKYEYEKIN